MKKHIAEELPARKHAPAAAPAGKGGEEKGGDEKKSPEKRVKQAIYDIRYRARREELPLRSAYSQYMQNSSMSAQEKTMVKAKLFGKGGMQAEDFNIEDAASTSVANALYKVFVEGVEKEQEPIRLTYMEKLETAEHKKYKVRVTGKDGRSYVRYADRQKISDLRANPNIESVEMTGYGEPYEGEKKKGEQTARAKAGKDYDGDGKVESPAKEYRGVVHNAIQKRRGGTPDGQDTSSVKEEFIGEVKSEKDDSDKTIHVMKGKNKVTVNPEAPGTSNGGRGMQIAHYDMGGNSLSESQAKFFTMLQEKAVSQNQQQLAAMAIEYLDGNMPDASDAVKQMAKMGRKELKKFAKTKHKGLPTHKEENECGSEDEKSKMKKTEGETDSREIPTKVNLMKNKLRSMGLKMSYEPEGEDIHEVPLVVAAPLVAGGVALAAKGLGHLMNKAVEAGQKNPNRRLVTGGTVGDLNKARGISNSYQPEGEVIDEAGSARYLQSKALRSGSATLSTPIETGASLRSKVQALKSKDTTPAPAPRPATSTATPTPRPISGVEALKKRMKLGGASSPYLNQSYDPEGNVVSDGYDSRYGRGEMGEQIQEKDEKVEAEFKRARTPHLLSQFRQKHPGSRQPKKERGAKETESEKQRRLTNRQVARAVKHGLTKKEKGESEARAKYDSPRD